MGIFVWFCKWIREPNFEDKLGCVQILEIFTNVLTNVFTYFERLLKYTLKGMSLESNEHTHKTGNRQLKR